MAIPEQHTRGSTGGSHPLTRHVVVAAERTPAWTELVHALRDEGV